MAQTKKPAPTAEELFASIDAIGGDDENESTASAMTSQAGTKKPTPATSSEGGDDDGKNSDDDEEDPADLAELKNLAAGRNSTSSRPNTPRLAAPSAGMTRSSSGLRSGATTEMYTPTTGSGRSSEERAAAEGGEKILKAPAAPISQSQKDAGGGGGGGWWGGFSAFASAAVKQAQGAVQELQKNEEAQRWAEQMRGNVGALRGIGGQISSRALPTFTNILHTLAPPISQHERLQIHITHDFLNYPSLDPLIYQTFSRVMSQVEGGDLLVIQRGSESTHRRSDSRNSMEGAYRGGLGSGSGWGDGPWWRQNDDIRSLGAVKGLVEGTKLVRVSAETYSQEFFAARGGIEEAAKAAAQVLNEDNPVRSSDIFLAIQAIQHSTPKELFAASKTKGEETEAEAEAEASTESNDAENTDSITFAIYLHDPIHSINFSGLSQSFPAKWAEWIDAKNSTSHSSPSDQESSEESEKPAPQLPEEILEIIESGGVDPREWVAEWMEEVLALSVGVIAQRYVARRMGVGEGGIGRGAARKEAVVEANAGEAARAL